MANDKKVNGVNVDITDHRARRAKRPLWSPRALW